MKLLAIMKATKKGFGNNFLEEIGAIYAYLIRTHILFEKTTKAITKPSLKDFLF